jgi:hypothetical protein
VHKDTYFGKRDAGSGVVLIGGLGDRRRQGVGPAKPVVNAYLSKIYFAGLFPGQTKF